MALLDPVDIGVEAGEAKRRTDRIGQSEQPAETGPAFEIRPELGQRLQHPQIEDDRRRDSEGGDVRQRVELGAEAALAVQEPRDPPVQPIEDRGEDDRADRLVPLAAYAEADS